MKRIHTLLALSIFSISIFAQIKIAGSITDDLGEPLPFATIAVRGTTIGTTSDMEGLFVLEIPQEKATIEVSLQLNGFPM